MRKAGIIVAAALIASPAFASNWIQIGSNSTGDPVLIDASSPVRTGATVTAWYKVDLSRNAKETDRSILQQMRMNCSARTIGTISVARYRADGSTSYSRSLPSYSVQDTPVVPDSVGEAMFEVACKGTEPT